MIRSVSIPIGDLGDFLLLLYEDLHLAASTVRTYKAASLSAFLPRQSFTPAQLGTLNKLCNVFHRSLPKPSPIPTWDIGLVLRAFTLAPFEPLDTELLEAITYKTFVLTALALGAHRVGAFRVDGRLGGTPVKGTRILGACLGGDAVGGEDERMGAENEVAWTAPGASQGPRRQCMEGMTTDESVRGAVGCEKRRCHEGEREQSLLR